MRLLLATLVGLFLLAAPCAQAAIVVTDIGAKGTAPASTTVSLTSVTVPTGATIVCEAVDAGTTVGGGSISDGVNTYTSAGTVANNNNATGYGYTQVYYVLSATALSSGTITYTYSSGGGYYPSGLSCFYATGISAYDSAVFNTAYGASSSPTITSGTPSVSGDLMVAVFGAANSTTVSHPLSTDTGHGWATPPDLIQYTNIQSGIGGEQVNSGSGTIVFAPGTGGYAPGWGEITLGFKPVAVAGGNYQSLLGVGR